MHLAHNAFRKAHCAITGTTYWSEIALQKALVENAFPDNCIVFIDGITTAYLSSHIDARKVLFLHADHRDATGEVVPRSRYLIEAFKGDAIVTATHAHKARLQDDLAASAPIRVIPHYIDAAPRPPRQRRHISTVSRLDLDGKPIHHAIEAFTRVMHRLPGCDYLIYGTGIGEARLKQLIRHHGCEDRIHLMGHTVDAAEVFSGALMSIAPTMTEGFGLSLLESLAQGCPVISYDVDYGPRELITPGQNGELVQPSDISALAQAILKVFAQHDAYSAACVPSTAPYTLEAHRRAYSQLIDDLMDEARFFDICAADMTSEVKRALGQTPAQHRGQLVDLLISLCVQRRDLEGLYAAFLQKHALAPRAERPLMRCIWLSRKLGRPDACAAHLHKLADRFPKSYRRLIERHPDVLAFAENG